VNEVAKQIEGLLGRLPEHKQQGSVIVDIDLFGWNGCIVRPEDYNRPYVQRLLPDLEAIL
jgi:2-amino-4-hydroxy-6-hydroxymethyldihydropteridine diphosphokinase